MTAVSIDFLRERIHPPIQDEQKEDDLWKFFDVVNCYSYALGLLYDVTFLNPGQISRMQLQKQYTDQELLERVFSDIHVLGMGIRKSTLEEEILSDNEWKIAIMNTDTSFSQERYDYHFLKQNTNKQWFQKIPFDQFPTKYDSRYRTITNPETATYSYHYHLVGYFVVTKDMQS
ncbi:MAG: hypothetical protein IKL55_01885 [Clostridia bacterium]|nr:hypothetical protein [Clostridia bacterium]